MFAIIASVVSMPPKRSTAAFDAISSPPRPPASAATAATSDVEGSRLERGLDRRAEPLERRPPTAVGLAAPGDRRHLGDDVDVPAERHLWVDLLEPERVHHRHDRERAGDLTAEVGRAARRDQVEQAFDLVAHDGREPRANGVEPKRRRERVALPAMARTVEREHARADDLRRREARVVDGERLRVAHRLENEITPGDDPAAERGHPRDRLARAQTREHRVRLALELRERDRRANRETCPHRARIDLRPRAGLARGGGKACRG